MAIICVIFCEVCFLTIGKKMTMTQQQFDVERASVIFGKYNIKPIVWYPDYPEKVHWKQPFTQDDYKAGLRDFHAQETSLLYLHMPYCPKQCLFCNCKTVISRDYEKVHSYMDWLYKEIKMHVDFCLENGLRPQVTEMHLGGGSPDYLNRDDFAAYMEHIKTFVNFSNLEEISMEIDPRHAKPGDMEFYHSMGINRVSFGIQDFDPEVQKAIDRAQPDFLITRLLVPEVRNLFPNGINFDIMFGLPLQTRDSFRGTMEKVVEFSPDRISLLRMNMTPKHFPHQLLMPVDKVPDALTTRALLYDAIQILTANGYVRTAFDHFAKPEDSVAKAKETGTMKWGSFGSTAGRYQDFLGLGNSGISRLGPRYSAQNVYELETWQQMISESKFPVLRGHKISDDDRIRRDITQHLRTYPSIQYEDIEKEHGINFPSYFSRELDRVSEFAKDGLVDLTEYGFEMTEFGSLFADFIAENFDAYVHGPVR